MQSFLSFDPFLSDFLPLKGSSFYKSSTFFFALPETNCLISPWKGRKSITSSIQDRESLQRLSRGESFIDFESMECQAEPESKRYIGEVTRWWWWWKSHRIQMNALSTWDETFLGQKLSFSFMFIAFRSEWVHIARLHPIKTKTIPFSGCCLSVSPDRGKYKKALPSPIPCVYPHSIKIIITMTMESET